MESRQPYIYASVFATLVASTVALVCRFCARRMTKQWLGVDDYLALAAYLFGGCWIAIVLLWTARGLGLHLHEIAYPLDETLYWSRLYMFLMELAYGFSLGFSKLAILAFYWRLFGLSNLRIPIIILIVLSGLWLVIRSFISVFHCVPVEAFWDNTIQGAVCEIKDSKFFTGTLIAHLALDLAIMSLPVLQIRQMKLRSSQKIGVSAMFLFGIFVCIATVIVITYSSQLDMKSNDIPWNMAPIMAWANVEVNLAVVSACLPLVRPVFLKVLALFRVGSQLDASRDDICPSRGSKSFLRFTTLLSPMSGEESDTAHILANYRARARELQKGPKVAIYCSKEPGTVEKGILLGNQTGGIMVRSEIGVSVSDRV
ncbi:hypothetical protein GGR56DRAFT_694796 [Xylariaceae sp. FL0804]|nr:hypothetical protein GGR56DRAFT_694796 [Xylariaceae sp. FL0804]